MTPTTPQGSALTPQARGRDAFTLTELLVVIGLILFLLAMGAFAMHKITDAAAHSTTRTILAELQTVAAEFSTANNGISVNHLSSVTSPFNWNTFGSITRMPKAPSGEYFYTTDMSANGRYDPTNAKSCYPNLGGKYFRPLPDPPSPSDPLTPPTKDAFRGYLMDWAGDLKAISGKRFIAGAFTVPACKEQLQSMDRHYITSSTGMDYAKATDCLPLQGAAAVMVVDGMLEPRDAWGTKIVYAAYVFYPEPGGDFETTDDFLPKRSTPFFVSAGPDRDFGDVGPNATEASKKAAEDNIYSYDTK
ncbi:MAG: type II secretion system GspH family protein [Planctomycetes bacterium]|nr:type II secretion system GspH family protein [Planctomycetota bacterium]